ncbi:SDR family NAD(P)-dependent oxidoreductase [Embleya hyalina]|uniref:Oxidoreductase n=1 Tax=Embleya hyalina TaxID=516124 RepID=A0A401Z1R9_9ACTN|nr:SDR family NAD(P)-dependent oxidoreductase [Embleya hyalina]GCE00787.1 oxidoreductase [Embleya hyalina]
MAGLIIVGAGPLIGQSVARRFAREGLPVAVVARGQGTVDKVVAAVADEGGRAIGFTADAADEASLHSALDAATAAHGVPDALVYNAGVIRADRLGELSSAELLDTLAINVVGALATAARVGPAMAAAGRGTIIVTGGMRDPDANRISLSLGKSGVRTATELIGREFGPAGVHVTTVTVCDVVEAGTPYDPDLIADTYWELHLRTPEQWERVVLFAR